MPIFGATARSAALSAEDGHRPLQMFYEFALVHSILQVRPAGRTESSAPTRCNAKTKTGGASLSPTVRRNAGQLRTHSPSPHQSAAPTAIPTLFVPAGHFPLIGGICPPRGSRGAADSFSCGGGFFALFGELSVFGQLFLVLGVWVKGGEGLRIKIRIWSASGGSFGRWRSDG